MKNGFLCDKCGERTDAMTEHILLYCPSANTFRFVLWRKVFSHFGVEFFGRFISLSPSKCLIFRVSWT